MARATSITCDLCGKLIDPIKWMVEISLNAPLDPMSTRIHSNWDACNDCSKKVIASIVELRYVPHG